MKEVEKALEEYRKQPKENELKKYRFRCCNKYMQDKELINTLALKLQKQENFSLEYGEWAALACIVRNYLLDIFGFDIKESTDETID